MPLETTPANNSSFITPTSDEQFRGTISKGSLLAVIFFALSAFVFAAQMLDRLPVLTGNLEIVKMLASAVAGALGGFAAARSGLFTKKRQ